MEVAIGAAISGLSSYLQGRSERKAQKKAVRRAEAADAAERATMQRQQDAIAVEQSKQDAIVADRERESAAAAAEDQRIRRKGGRGGLLTFVDTGAAGVSGGLSTALGGGSR